MRILDKIDHKNTWKFFKFNNYLQVFIKSLFFKISSLENRYFLKIYNSNYKRQTIQKEEKIRGPQSKSLLAHSLINSIFILSSNFPSSTYFTSTLSRYNSKQRNFSKQIAMQTYRTKSHQAVRSFVLRRDHIFKMNNSHPSTSRFALQVCTETP